MGTRGAQARAFRHFGCREVYDPTGSLYDACMLMEPKGQRLRFGLRRRKGRRTKGRILAIKWGLNPNSSSLGVDVTFLLFGAAALSLATPFVSALVRLKLAKEPELVNSDAEQSS